MEITEGQFKEFSRLVYTECGINLHEGKQQLLSARLAKRMRKVGINSVNEYIDVVKSNNKELVDFLDAISTNHTFFFREEQHFKFLDRSHLNIWCAASSSGEEPYSVAIDCLEKGFKPAILATDISTKALSTGKIGIYPVERIRGIELSLLRKYFQKGQGKWNGYIRVRDEVRKMVTFRRFNLIRDALPRKEYDVIFCRNVMIYFDNIVKERLVNKLYNVLKWEGYLIIGGAESLNNLEHKYKYIKPSIYKKI